MIDNWVYSVTDPTEISLFNRFSKFNLKSWKKRKNQFDLVSRYFASFQLVLKEMKKNNVPTDIDFYNMLIKKRATRHDYEKAQVSKILLVSLWILSATTSGFRLQEVLNLIQADYLQPDIVTFGVLAISCNKVHEAVELVHQLMDFGYR